MMITLMITLMMMVVVVVVEMVMMVCEYSLWADVERSVRHVRDTFRVQSSDDPFLQLDVPDAGAPVSSGRQHDQGDTDVPWCPFTIRRPRGQHRHRGRPRHSHIHFTVSRFHHRYSLLTTVVLQLEQSVLSVGLCVRTFERNNDLSPIDLVTAGSSWPYRRSRSKFTVMRKTILRWSVRPSARVF